MVRQTGSSDKHRKADRASTIRGPARFFVFFFCFLSLLKNFTPRMRAFQFTPAVLVRWMHVLPGIDSRCPIYCLAALPGLIELRCWLAGWLAGLRLNVTLALFRLLVVCTKPNQALHEAKLASRVKLSPLFVAVWVLPKRVISREPTHQYRAGVHSLWAY